eukprot:GAHX01001373.1.p1 GENE.GAHX01001373.1~~GAHX01001373.1.p1  ORF type:complete len:174 (-),score=37.19 GAHX01001373.1:92-613(-)
MKIAIVYAYLCWNQVDKLTVQHCFVKSTLLDKHAQNSELDKKYEQENEEETGETNTKTETEDSFINGVQFGFINKRDLNKNRDIDYITEECYEEDDNLELDNEILLSSKLDYIQESLETVMELEHTMRRIGGLEEVNFFNLEKIREGLEHEQVMTVSKNVKQLAIKDFIILKK